jgi:hypothetical protein
MPFAGCSTGRWGQSGGPGPTLLEIGQSQCRSGERISAVINFTEA